jgi:hypothetical protein
VLGDAGDADGFTALDLLRDAAEMIAKGGGDDFHGGKL